MVSKSRDETESIYFWVSMMTTEFPLSASFIIMFWLFFRSYIVFHSVVLVLGLYFDLGTRLYGKLEM